MDELSARMVDGLCEAAALLAQGRYGEARSAAHAVREAAQRPVDLARAIVAAAIEATALRGLGENGAALAAYAWLVGLAQDPARRAAMAEAGPGLEVDLEREIVNAYIGWVETAGDYADVETAALLEVLDGGEEYVRRIGKPLWRAGLLYTRAQLLHARGDVAGAISAAEAGLSQASDGGDGPGATLSQHRLGLAALELGEKQYEVAIGLYGLVLADERSEPQDRTSARAGLVQCHAGAVLGDGQSSERVEGALVALIDVWLKQRDVATARRVADRLLEGARALGEPASLCNALCVSALVAVAEKDGARARALLDEARPHAEARDREAESTLACDTIAGLRTAADGLSSGEA